MFTNSATKSATQALEGKLNATGGYSIFFFLKYSRRILKVSKNQYIYIILKKQTKKSAEIFTTEYQYKNTLPKSIPSRLASSNADNDIWFFSIEKNIFV